MRESAEHPMEQPIERPSELAGTAVRRTVRVGWLLLAVSLPFGVAVEVLHALKAPFYV